MRISRPEPVAGRAGAERIVEREQPRLDLGDREADTGQANLDEKTMRLGSPFCVLLVGELDDGDAVGELERRLEALGEPGGDVAAHDDPVDHDVDVVLELLVEGRRLGDLVERRRRS